MKVYNKGGRPTKSLVEKRTYRVNLKMNTEEYYTLKARASEAGMSPCDFIRASSSRQKSGNVSHPNGWTTSANCPAWQIT